ncbi:hypothetical protein D0T66_12540 [Dysgonomonas sp. 25]|nr:hypothetical protein [Dysgonomonas sp. 25]
MDNNKEKDKKSFRFIWSLLMVFIYMGIAYLFTMTPIFEDKIDWNIRVGIAILVTIYAIIRGYRLWKLGK